MMKVAIVPLVLVAMAVLCTATPAAAQSAVCVYLQPGVGYAAQMRAISTNFDSGWSDTYAVDNWRCAKLAEVPHGNTVKLEVHAILGETKTCASFTRDAKNTATVTYFATGGTLSVRCFGLQ